MRKTILTIFTAAMLAGASVGAAFAPARQRADALAQQRPLEILLVDRHAGAGHLPLLRHMRRRSFAIRVLRVPL